MPSTSSAKLARDLLRNAAPGEPAEVWIYSAFEKEHWLPRSSGDMTHAEHPGTAIKIGDDLYEIVTTEGTVEPGYEVRYGLKKWDAHHVIRKIIPYTQEAQAQAADSHLEEAHRQKLRRRIVRLFFLAGMAPDPMQRKWEMETALSMVVISVASALTEVFVFMTLVQIFGRTAGNPRIAFLIEYIGVDSFVRLLWIVISGQPHGILILSLPSLFWEAITRPEKRVEKKERVKVSIEGDEVIRRPSSGHLTIRSMLYDELLAGTAPIVFEGNVYKPLHFSKDGVGLSRRWIYEYEKSDADPKKQYREYTRPRTPERQKIVEEATRRHDRVHIFAMVWGTYSREEQLRLQAQYQFPAVHWTAITSGFFLAGAVLQGWVMLMLAGPMVGFICPVYMILESLYRLYQSKVQGQPARSLLGLILNFFVHAPQ